MHHSRCANCPAEQRKTALAMLVVGAFCNVQASKHAEYVPKTRPDTSEHSTSCSTRVTDAETNPRHEHFLVEGTPLRICLRSSSKEGGPLAILWQHFAVHAKSMCALVVQFALPRPLSACSEHKDCSREFFCALLTRKGSSELALVPLISSQTEFCWRTGNERDSKVDIAFISLNMRKWTEPNEHPGEGRGNRHRSRNAARAIYIASFGEEASKGQRTFDCDRIPGSHSCKLSE